MICHPNHGERLGYIEAWKKYPRKMTIATVWDVATPYVIYECNKLLWHSELNRDYNYENSSN